MYEEEAIYADRAAGGRVLAERLGAYGQGQAVVLAIPNGGVAVAAPIAAALDARLRLLVVRKMQIPGNTEAGFGAVAADGSTVLNQGLLRQLRLSPAQIETQRQQALASIRERLERYGSWAELPELAGRAAILVDDGLASGATMEAAVGIVRQRGPTRVVVAAPTASLRASALLTPLVDELVCPHVGRGPYFAVANAYQRWYDVSEQEVLELLQSLEKA